MVLACMIAMLMMMIDDEIYDEMMMNCKIEVRDETARGCERARTPSQALIRLRRTRATPDPPAPGAPLQHEMNSRT